MSTKEKAKQIILQPSHVKVYNFVKEYIEKNMFSPKLTEVAKGIKLTDRQSYNLINELVELGYLSKEAHRKRGIAIVKKLG